VRWRTKKFPNRTAAYTNKIQYYYYFLGDVMRKLEEIENDLKQAREELSHVEGAPAEVYSRIVGYYRSVRNWNKGKREEYGERRLYDVGTSAVHLERCTPGVVNTASAVSGADNIKEFPASDSSEPHILLFVRPGCPACPGAKAAAGKLGIPVNTIDAASEDGLAEAARRNVMSTPTAILIDKKGVELSRARNSADIASLRRFMPDAAAAVYKNAASM
jgi:ribonucleoside-triphosphate reductase